MAQKVVLTEEERQLPSSELAQKYAVSRTTAWRARKSGWLVPGFHHREIKPDLLWAATHEKTIINDAQRGVYSVLGRWADRGGCTREELVAPFAIADVVGRAIVRLVELSGHSDREFEGWRIRVAQHAARDFMDWLWRRTKSTVQLDPSPDGEDEDTGRPDRIFYAAQLHDEAADEMEAARARLIDLVPDDILDIAVRVADGEKISKKEAEQLAGFREKWSWLVK